VAHLESPFLELGAIEELEVAAGIGGHNDGGFGAAQDIEVCSLDAFR